MPLAWLAALACCMLINQRVRQYVPNPTVCLARLLCTDSIWLYTRILNLTVSHQAVCRVLLRFNVLTEAASFPGAKVAR